MKKINMMMIRMMNKLTGTFEALEKDESGVEIIVALVMLAILIGFATIFHDTLSAFIDDLFKKILVF